MNRSLLLLFCLLPLLLNACGPKDIGNASLEEEPIHTSVSTAEQMRYPAFGSDAIQRQLFYDNKMQNMVARQNIMRSSLKHPAALSPEHPDYRAVPKEKSPFRQ